METIRQIVQVNSDRRIEITLPATVTPGLIEVVIFLQAIPTADSPKDSRSETLHEYSSQPLDLFGFLQRQVNPPNSKSNLEMNRVSSNYLLDTNIFIYYFNGDRVVQPIAMYN